MSNQRGNERLKKRLSDEKTGRSLTALHRVLKQAACGKRLPARFTIQFSGMGDFAWICELKCAERFSRAMLRSWESRGWVVIATQGIKGQGVHRRLTYRVLPAAGTGAR